MKMDDDERDPFDELRQGLRGEDDGRWRPDGRRVALGTLGALVLAAAIISATALRPDRSEPRAIGSAAVPEGEPPTTTVTSTAPDGAAVRVWPAEPVEVDGSEVRTGGHRWEVGGPGDTVVVGDWDCDGASTPSVLRPSERRLFVFDEWATADVPLTARPGPQVPADAVGVEAKGCGQAAVRTLAGAVVVVSTRGGDDQ